jgi:hypothetical protein
MKSQQGFVVFGAVPFLIGAAVVGGVVAVDAASTNDMQAVAARSQEQPTLTVAGAPADPSVAETYAAQPYEGHLYRNGGHFGDKNSDVKLESPDL